MADIQNTPLDTYLRTLINEKGGDVEKDLNRPGHIGLCYDNLIEFIMQMPASIQQDIRDTLVMIDYKNGDVFHYLNHLVDGMIDALNA